MSFPELLGPRTFKTRNWNGKQTGDFIGEGAESVEAAEQRKLGMTLAPHNFGSKMGFYAQLHLGRCVPNWEIAETDDSEFPAFAPEGFKIQRGVATVTGKPGLGVELREEFLGRATLDATA